jgi:hypothetical protein
VEFCIVVSLWLDPLLLNGWFLLPKFLQSGFWEFSNTCLIGMRFFKSWLWLRWHGLVISAGWSLSSQHHPTALACDGWRDKATTMKWGVDGSTGGIIVALC